MSHVGTTAPDQQQTQREYTHGKVTHVPQQQQGSFLHRTDIIEKPIKHIRAEKDIQTVVARKYIQAPAKSSRQPNTSLQQRSALLFGRSALIVTVKQTPTTPAQHFLSRRLSNPVGKVVRPCLQVIQCGFERVAEDEGPQDEKEVLMPDLKI
jgi:hypothetical protein